MFLQEKILIKAPYLSHFPEATLLCIKLKIPLGKSTGHGRSLRVDPIVAVDQKSQSDPPLLFQETG